ncbi:MAG TPA: hypothetical protein VFW20_04380 [Candidatus Limnocylindrales bacterium]|nr:hypothetical protein [Candidatus Limnocylindrales bacterium]
MGSRTAAARAEVVAAREGLASEVARLEASGRAAVDIPARIRREPAKVAGAASGAAFLLLGGPGRVFRGARRVLFGPQADLPKSLLPKEVEKTLKKLGPDGEKVRGTLEREFADYLEEKAPQRRERDLGGATGALLGNLLRPITLRAGRQLAERLLDPDNQTFADALERVRRREPAPPAQPASAAASGASSGVASTAPAPNRRPRDGGR